MTQFSNETLAQRMDRAAERVSMAGLAGINAWIEQAAFQKQQKTGMSYNDALFAVAREQPWPFLTKARFELGRINYDEAIYFRWVDGQLVNPAVMEGGGFRALDSPLDVRVLPGANLEQEIALRVAAKMQQLAASEKGRPVSYGDALRLVGRECPELTRLWQRSTTGGRYL